MSWVKTEFSDFLTPPAKSARIDANEKNQLSMLRKKIGSRRKEEIGKFILWNFKPKSKEDLVVNKKKIEEVEHYLKYMPECSFLLITGPPGCGKMETVNVLCKLLNIECLEWLNPVNYEFDVCDSLYRCELTKFEEFIMCGTRYCNVLSSSSRRVIVIKDIPNIFLRVSSLFHEFLLRLKSVSVSLIFILSDTRVSRDLFPEHIKIDLPVKCIHFNPLTQKAVISALTNAVQKLDVLKHRPAVKEYINNASLLSNGDLRNALMTLHFLLAKEQSEDDTICQNLKKQSQKDTRSKDKLKSESLMSVRNDSNLDIFHGIGRVLYAKYEKGKLVHSPQDVADFFVSLPGLFVNMLHENYLNTFSSIHDVAQASDNLAISDLLLNNWKETNYDFTSVNGFGIAVASYGLMVVNSKPIKKFQQFNRGKCNDYKLHQKLKTAVDFSFISLNTREIILDLCPYREQIGSVGKSSDVYAIGRFCN